MSDSVAVSDSRRPDESRSQTGEGPEAGQRPVSTPKAPTGPSVESGSPTEQESIDPVAKNASRERMRPKEHGAYAILGIPLLVALLLTGFNLIGLAIAVAAICGFLSHEPLLISLGKRGGRAQRTAPQAVSRMRWLATMAVAAGGLAMVLGSPAVRGSLLACLLCSIPSFLFAAAGKHRTGIAQTWGVVGLSIPCLPILLAGGYPLATAVSIWGVWLIGFGSTTIAVHSVIAAQKGKSRLGHLLVLPLLLAIVATAAYLSKTWALLSLPMMAAAWYLWFFPPPAKHLKRVGWCLVASTVVTAGCLFAFPVG